MSEYNYFGNKAENNTFNQEKDNNFFLDTDDDINFYGSKEPAKRLNDYDFNILKENAYKDIDDEALKLEYKINKIEGNINIIEKQIQAAKDIRDFNLAEELFEQKRQMSEELIMLKNEYKSISLSAKVSSAPLFANINILKQKIISFYELFISKLPGQMASFSEIKNSLKKLENINKNVDELISMKIPYGEAAEKYEQLTKYITKANFIQSEISKHVRLR
mgnify:CR=1 FL=1